MRREGEREGERGGRKMESEGVMRGRTWGKWRGRYFVFVATATAEIETLSLRVAVPV